MSTNNNTRESNSTNDVKLLLHGIDGIIPYMTPILLRNHFHPTKNHMIAKHFLLGIAVRDTCVVPVFPSDDHTTSTTINKKKKDKKMKRLTTTTTSSKDNEDNSNSNHNDQEKSTTTKKKKPKGYTFVSTSIDNYLSGYNTVILPSFDLYQDVIDIASTSSKKKETIPITQTSNDKQIMVWTPHGRHILSKDIYFNSTRGFTTNTRQPLTETKAKATDDDNTNTNVVSVVPLYDMALNNDTNKRKQSAINRTKIWLDHYIGKQKEEEQHQQQTSSGRIENKVWAPVILTCLQEEEETGNSNDKRNKNVPKLREIVEESISQHNRNLSGIILLGCHHNMKSRSAYRDNLQAIINSNIKSIKDHGDIVSKQSSSLAIPIKKDICVSTNISILQILDSIRLGVNIIGCSLPTTWAKSKKAFVVDVEGWRRSIAKKEGVQTLQTHLGKSSGNECENNIPNKRQKISQDKVEVDENGCIDLHNDDFVLDRSALLDGCQCLSCSPNTSTTTTQMTKSSSYGSYYSRSYLHHLVLAKELLCEILLFGHNLYQMLLLCQEASIAKNENKIDDFCTHIEAQLNNLSK